MLKPMLAKPFNHKWLSMQIFAQPKLDGMRMIWDGHSAWSRTGKPILAFPKLIKILEGNFSGIPLDGELYRHGASFQELISPSRKTVNIDEDESIQFHVYDYPVEGMYYNKRLEQIIKMFNHFAHPRIVPVETFSKCAFAWGNIDPQTLNVFAKDGYEGTMIRNADGLYKFGKRSSDLMKIKTFDDAEFKIIALEPRKEFEKVIVPEGTPGSKTYSDGTCWKNGTETVLDTCGAIVCELPDGQLFKVGTGLDEAEAERLWKNPPIGKMVTVKYQGVSEGGIPRFPVYKCIRDFE